MLVRQRSCRVVDRFAGHSYLFYCAAKLDETGRYFEMDRRRESAQVVEQ